MSILDSIQFNYCPRCGEKQLQPNDAKSLVCRSCGFVYYHGTAAVVVGIIESGERIILARRANEPQKGYLTLPGGFVDYEETLEAALVRELREELNLPVSAPAYLFSHWDRYLYREVVYFTCIAYFRVKVQDISQIAPQDDIDAFLLIRPELIEAAGLAFESDRAALARYRALIESERAGPA